MSEPRHLDTQPLDVGQPASREAGLNEFRMHAPLEVRALLRQLVDGSVLVNVSGSDGTAYTTTIWAIDTARGTLSLSADAADPKVQRLIEPLRSAWAAIGPQVGAVRP